MSSVHSDEYKRLIAKLKAARLAANLTQEEVAGEFGQPQSFISKIESGERRIDPIELRRFAELYGKRVSFFLESSE